MGAGCADPCAPKPLRAAMGSIYHIPVWQGDLEQEIAGVSYDSRKTAPGDLFVAMRGYAADGHAFIPMAKEKGAVCVLCEQAPEIDIPWIRVSSGRRALAMLSLPLLTRM